MDTLNSIQAYRGFAAILVVLIHSHMTFEKFHSTSKLTSFFSFGHAGVEFFFVLSGFILYYVYFIKTKNSGIDLKSFLMKRFIRIYPLYWFITLAFLPLWLFKPGFGEPHQKEIQSLIFSLLLFPQTHPPHIAPAWSLIHEILFYIMFSVIILNRKIGFLFGAVWFSAIIVTNLNSSPPIFPLSFFLSKYNLLFGFGIMAGILSSRYRDTLNRYGIQIFLAGNALFLIIGMHENYLSDKSDGIAHTWFFGLASFIIILGCTTKKVESFFSKKKIMLFLGEASYSIYLFHWFAVELVCKKLKDFGLLEIIPLDIAFFIVVFAGITGGSIVYLSAEKYIVKWMKLIFHHAFFDKNECFNPNYLTSTKEEGAI